MADKKELKSRNRLKDKRKWYVERTVEGQLLVRNRKIGEHVIIRLI